MSAAPGTLNDVALGRLLSGVAMSLGELSNENDVFVCVRRVDVCKSAAMGGKWVIVSGEGCARLLPSAEDAADDAASRAERSDEVCAEHRNTVVREFGEPVPALMLFDIRVPQSMRRRGVCTRIIDGIEQRAKREGRRFIVGPIMADADGTEHVGDLCHRRGETFPPCMFMRPDSV